MITLTLAKIDSIQWENNKHDILPTEEFNALCDAARRGVEAPAVENQNARFAIEGCIEYGRQGINPPPDNHWLAPFWNMGKKLSELAEKDDRLTHLEEAYQSAMRVGSEAQQRAEKAEAALAEAVRMQTLTARECRFGFTKTDCEPEQAMCYFRARKGEHDEQH